MMPEWADNEYDAELAEEQAQEDYRERVAQMTNAELATELEEIARFISDSPEETDVASLLREAAKRFQPTDIKAASDEVSK